MTLVVPKVIQILLSDRDAAILPTFTHEEIIDIGKTMMVAKEAYQFAAPPLHMS